MYGTYYSAYLSLFFSLVGPARHDASFALSLPPPLLSLSTSVALSSPGLLRSLLPLLPSPSSLPLPACLCSLSLSLFPHVRGRGCCEARDKRALTASREKKQNRPDQQQQQHHPLRSTVLHLSPPAMASVLLSRLGALECRTALVRRSAAKVGGETCSRAAI